MKNRRQKTFHVEGYGTRVFTLDECAPHVDDGLDRWRLQGLGAGETMTVGWEDPVLTREQIYIDGKHRKIVPRVVTNAASKRVHKVKPFGDLKKAPLSGRLVNPNATEGAKVLITGVHDGERRILAQTVITKVTPTQITTADGRVWMRATGFLRGQTPVGEPYGQMIQGTK